MKIALASCKSITHSLFTSAFLLEWLRGQQQQEISTLQMVPFQDRPAFITDQYALNKPDHYRTHS